MILKDRDTEFNFVVYDSNRVEGLGSDDYWCQIVLTLHNTDVNFMLDYYMLSRNELIYLKEKLIQLIQGDIDKRERVSFIKNFLVIYLDGVKKEMKIKLVHINYKKINYVIYFSCDEVKKFIEMLN